MADVIKTRKVVQLVAEFADGDDRTISLDNPDPALDEAQLAAKINEASAFAKANGLLLGDKNQATFTRFKNAKKVESTTKYLDLTD